MERQKKSYNNLFKQTTVGSFILMIIAGCLSCKAQEPQGFVTADKFSLLWEISGNGLKKPSYLHGTIHMYDTGIFKIPQEVYKTIDMCDNFALEIDFTKVDHQSLTMRSMIMDADSTLDKLISAEVYAEIIKIPLMKAMGDQLNRMKPILFAPYLMIEDPMATNSVDLNLNEYALQQNKNIIGIETADEQMDIIDMISLSDQVQEITNLYNYCKQKNISFHEAGKIIFGKLQLAYKNQDMDAFESMEKDFQMTSGSPVADSAMIANRNVNMANRISDFIQQDKTLFTAVGTLHLPDYKNMRGVVTLLKEKGYNMRPILIEL